MKFHRLTFISLLGVFLYNVSFAQQQDITDPNVISYPAEKVAKAGTVIVSDITEDWHPFMKTFEVIHTPGVNSEKDRFLALKKQANTAMLEAEQNSQSNITTKYGTLVQAPIVGYNFYGNGYGGSIPNDNNIAVGNDGKTLSVINSNIRIAKITGQFLKGISLDAFSSSILGNDAKYDPVCTYDNLNGRYILVFLNGYTNSTSKIVVAFSQTNAPEGAWNLYTLDGNATGNVWTDFPQIGISTEELFITGNLFTNSGNGKGTAIWQIDLSDGYNGSATISTKKYTSSNYFSLHPVEAGIVNYGPEFYFIRSASIPQGTSNSIRLHRITNTIENNGTLVSPVTLTSNLSYRLPPDASQKNTFVLLQTNDCRIQSSFVENNEIQFALNSSTSNRASIYLGRIQLNTTNYGQSTLTGQIIYSSTYHYAYPSVAYGGATNSNGRNSTLLFFNYAGSSKFPGNAAVFIDTLKSVSNLTFCKTGLDDIGSSSPYRWGDYTGAAERKSNPGEVWVAGSMGNNNHTAGTWIAQVSTPDVHVPVYINESEFSEDISIQTFPNPVIDIVNFTFNVQKTGIYTARILDVNGRLVKELIRNKLKTGVAKIEFNAAMLESGTYFIIIENDTKNSWSSKFIVGK